MPHGLFRFSDRITAVPVVYGSGDFAVELRRIMLAEKFDCLAIPLPPSFKHAVEQAIGALPNITVVVQPEPRDYEAPEEAPLEVNFVPIDPCQPLIAAIRVALGERMPRQFIDLEVERFEPYAAGFPDAYALKKLPLEKFVAAVLPALGRLPKGQPRQRIAQMAQRLVELEKKYQSILFPCSLLDWPWVREAYNDLKSPPDKTPAKQRRKPLPPAQDAEVESPEICQPDPRQLLFCLGELPFITALYERARAQLDDDENLSIDGVKELLITARDFYKQDLKKQARPITPKLLALLLKYIRNLSLVERRLTPDLYTLVIASQQFAGDTFALEVAETARRYEPRDEGGRMKDESEEGSGFGVQGSEDRGNPSVIGNSQSAIGNPSDSSFIAHPSSFPSVSLGLDQIRLPDGEIAMAKNRLAGPPMIWRSLELRRRPDRQQQKLWQMRWNPFRQCSWPPEDVAIERFRTHTFEKAKQIIGQDLARTEKFTTSVQDGIDIRETLRNWHTGDLYVKIFPPTRGSVDTVLMLFDSPADPREYPYRVTWHHEHSEESTLAFFATDFRKHVVGPGIAQAVYGGCMLVYPPIEPHIADVWSDPFFDAADTLEERLLMASCSYSREKHVALLSASPPGAAWRKIAKSFGRKLVHLPASHFSAATLQQLRIVHILNGHQVRSYAAEFIRKA